MPAKNILITGRPGVGKTTLIFRLIKQINLPCVGFYTAEIRESGRRTGFEAIALHGPKLIMSHVDIKSPYRVSKYGVDVANFERFLKEIPFFDPKYAFIVIDEIGKMECFSPLFKKLILNLLDHDTPLIATIALRGDVFIESIKTRHDVRVYTVTYDNRDKLAMELYPVLKELAKGRNKEAN